MWLFIINWNDRLDCNFFFRLKQQEHTLTLKASFVNQSEGQLVCNYCINFCQLFAIFVTFIPSLSLIHKEKNNGSINS